MKRPTLRLCVFASTIALSLGAGAISQAEAPKSFFSRLNPRNWFEKSNQDSKPAPAPGRAHVSDGAKRRSPTSSVAGMLKSNNESSRPYLKEDPFVNAPARQKSSHEQSGPATVAAVKPSTPQTGNHGSAGAIRRNPSPAAPQTSSSMARPVASSSVPKSRNQNQFADGFDSEFARLVENIRTAEGQSQSGSSNHKISGAASAPLLPESDSAARQVANNRTTMHADRTVTNPTARPQPSKSASSDMLMRNTGREPIQAPDPKAEFERFIAEREALRSPISRAKDVAEVSAKKPVSAEHSTDSAPVSPQELIAESRREMETPLTRQSPDAPAEISHSSFEGQSLIVASSLVPERKLYTASTFYRSAPRGDSALSSQGAAAAGQHADGLVIGAAHDSQAIAALDSAPKVSANKAPSRTVPDTGKFRQLSYDGADHSEPRLPLLSIGGGAKAAGTEDAPLLIIPTGTANDEAQGSADLKVASEAKTPIAWPADVELEPSESSSGSKWLLGLLILAGIGSGIGVKLRKKWQLSTIASSHSSGAPEIRQ